MSVGLTKVKSWTMIARPESVIECEVGEGGDILWVVKHCISELPYVVENVPETCDKSCLETASGLGKVPLVKSDVCLCH